MYLITLAGSEGYLFHVPIDILYKLGLKLNVLESQQSFPFGLIRVHWQSHEQSMLKEGSPESVFKLLPETLKSLQVSEIPQSVS
jgi:hypothetical protein